MCVCMYKDVNDRNNALYFFRKRKEIGSKMLHIIVLKSPEQSVNLSQFETVKLRNSQ